jgi:hypothetical protein
MNSPLELRLRAALCRQLAMSEPNSWAFWIAEAEAWSRLAEVPDDTAATRWDRFKGTGRHLPSRQVGGLIKKDPFEEFLDLIEIEND